MIKPDRAHYSSNMHQVILKMDHYCPWVRNCIGYKNYKFFILFIFYGFLVCLSIACLSLSPCLYIWKMNEENLRYENYLADVENHKNVSAIPPPEHLRIYSPKWIQVLFFFSILAGFNLLCFNILHLNLISKNVSTIEFYQNKVLTKDGYYKYPFHRGGLQNFKDVLGFNLWMLLPIGYENDELQGGTYFPLSYETGKDEGTQV